MTYAVVSMLSLPSHTFRTRTDIAAAMLPLPLVVVLIPTPRPTPRLAVSTFASRA